MSVSSRRAVGDLVRGEYAKLVAYDGETREQSPAKFFCHRQDGRLCAGWVACHDPQELIALRFGDIAPETYEYRSPVPVFESGTAAAAHGMREIKCPGERAEHMLEDLTRQLDGKVLVDRYDDERSSP